MNRPEPPRGFPVPSRNSPWVTRPVLDLTEGPLPVSDLLEGPPRIPDLHEGLPTLPGPPRGFSTCLGPPRGPSTRPKPPRGFPDPSQTSPTVSRPVPDLPDGLTNRPGPP